MHAKTAQPSHTIQTALRNEFLRAKRLCSNEKIYKEASDCIQRKLKKAGHYNKLVQKAKISSENNNK